MAMLDELVSAIKTGDRQEVGALLEISPHLAERKTDNGVSTTLVALYYGQAQIAMEIYKHDHQADVFTVAAIGDTARLEALIAQEPALVNAYSGDGFQPLGLACFLRQPQAARLLVLAGAQVNSPSRNQMQVMPLHSAVASQQLEIARLLLEAGAQVNAVQGGGFSALHSAAQNGQAEMVRLLLEYGADPGHRSEGGKTALDLAEENKHQDASALLAAL